MRCSNYVGFKGRLGTRVGTPLAESARQGRDLQRGIASWYGPGFHGRKTANGERFDMGELTAAHKTLPFGTRVLVHNPRNGKEVVVRINDRGPFVPGRVIDLSKAAAAVLGMQGRGHDTVVLREVPESQDDLLASVYSEQAAE